MFIDIVGYGLIVLSGTYILYPFFSRTSTILVDRGKEIEELIYQRQVSEKTISELELDHQTGKLNDEEYLLTVSECQQELKELDKQAIDQIGLTLSDWRQVLEAEISGTKPDTIKETSTCPNCGRATTPKDRFCSNCGEKLKFEN